MHIARFIVLSLLMAVAGTAAAQDTVNRATLYKDAYCTCCTEYAKYLEQNGYRVRVVIMDDMQPVKRKNRIPKPFESCHTTLIGDYVVEGHVPVAAIKKLLAERPVIKGISVPGMPAGSPGMTGEKTEPLTVYEIDPEKAKVFLTE